MTPIMLAHGALGAFDEIIFVSVALVFIGMMALSWIRARNAEPLTDADDATDQRPISERTEDAPERFTLE
jgi:hypothetical protein